MEKKIGTVRIVLLIIASAPLVMCAILFVQGATWGGLEQFVGEYPAMLLGASYNAIWLLLVGNRILGLFKNEEGPQHVSE